MTYRGLLTLTGLLLPAAALAQTSAPPPASTAQIPHVPDLSKDGHELTGLDAAQLFDLADQARTAGRLADAETIYKAVGHDPSVEIRSEARFRLGMLLSDERRYADAAVQFRAILDEQPKAARVRLELARVLAAMGDDSRARKELRQAQAGGLPPNVALVVDRFAAALRSNRKFGGNFEIGFAPDSNINRATSSTTLDTVIAPLTLSKDARAQSGIGAHLAGQLYLRQRLTNRLTLVPRISGDGLFYRTSEFNDVSGSALIGVEWQAGKDRITPSAGATWRYYGDTLYARTTNADLRWLHQLGRRAQSRVDVAYGRSNYQLNDLQDGNIYSLTAGVDRALSARTGLGVSLSATRQTARDPGYSTASGGLTVLGWHDMGKTTIFANATVRHLESDARLSLFPDRRKEWFMSALVGATFRQVQVAGFAPVMRVSYERNISTVGLYDYRRVNVDIGITRAF